MGKELKRVPLDFDWPLEKIWEGYLNPFHQYKKECEECEGSGYSPEARRLKDQWYGYTDFCPEENGSKRLTPASAAVRKFVKRQLQRDGDRSWYIRAYNTTNPTLLILREGKRLCALWNQQWSHHLNAEDVQALLDDGRLMDFTHTPRTKEQREIVRQRLAEGHNSWLPESNGYVPTPEEVNDWGILSMGHDSINAYVCIEAKCARKGWPVTCTSCAGSAVVWDSEEHRVASENWQRSEPPMGEGFQLWETTSEGSPVSPVFRNLDELCHWSARYATTFGSNRATVGEWKSMLEKGLVYHQEGNNIFI